MSASSLHSLTKSLAIIAVALSSAMSWTARAQEPRSASRSIDEGLFIDVNGIEQWITIRGNDLGNPVLLMLHGGPGASLSGLAPLFAEWEKYYTLVQWDQPSSGSTAVKNIGIDQGPLTVERYTRDGITVVEYARKRLGKDKLVLLGNSWGTRLGLEMVRKRPELFSAYVGTSQVVSGVKGGRIGYELALKAARERGDKVAIEALERIGPPPYRSFDDFLIRQKYTNPPGLPPSAAERAASLALMKLLSAPPPPDARYIAFRTLPSGFNGEENFLKTQREMFDAMWKWEARELGMTFPIPMFVFQGENDLNTPVAPVREYMEEIRAPKKVFVVIPGAGHNTIAFAPQLLELMNTHVRSLVSGSEK